MDQITAGGSSEMGLYAEKPSHQERTLRHQDLTPADERIDLLDTAPPIVTLLTESIPTEIPNLHASAHSTISSERSDSNRDSQEPNVDLALSFVISLETS